jgi:4-diphosphocytidyl-2-C-methyl-D-erythritol kinase
LIAFPNAKINLGLRVTEKRPDGYHNLQTCFVPVGWCDALEIVESGKTSLHVSGLRIAGSDTENLCIKAWRLLNKDFDIPAVDIYLHKNIPMGGGLGGGSSDAAFTLRMLSDHFNLALGDELLGMYAEVLGSDCPFFIRNRISIGEGKGEILEPLDCDLSSFEVVVVYPEVHIETARAYAGIRPAVPTEHLRDVLLQVPVAEWKNHVINDFEKGVFDLVPELAALKKTMYEQGAVYASMSGSGSSVYGLFKFDPTLDLPGHYRIWKGSIPDAASGS